MPITSDDVKSIVYDHIDEMGRENIREILSSSHGQEYLCEIVDVCRRKVQSRGGNHESELGMLTTILHFTMSLAAVPSHRKVVNNGVELDVVVPDLRTLQKSPESALVMCILAPDTAAEQVSQIVDTLDSRAKIITVLVQNPGNLKYDTYAVDDSTFQNIIRDVRAFLDSTKRVNFGMIS